MPAADALDSGQGSAFADGEGVPTPRVVRSPRPQAPARLGPYRYLEKLGQGGMGVVYRMVEDSTGEEVAVKTALLVQHRIVAALRAEMKTLQRIRHAGVVRIVGGGTTDGLPWYAMELLGPRTVQTFAGELWRGLGSWEESGVTLTAKQRELAALPCTQAGTSAAGAPRNAVAGGRLEETLRLFGRLAEVLAHIHGLGLVHRDLKPANVFLRADGAPVVADFGLASRAFGSLGRSALTQGEERLLGTPSYASPEQISGQFVDARADLYSLGCMLFEALTGRPPFVQLGDVSVLQQHLSATPLPPSELVSGVPPVLDALVLRLLAKEPRGRSLPAEQVAQELLLIAGEAVTTSSPALRAAYLYLAPLAGRQDTLAELERRRTEARSGGGSLVLLCGESGIGKTSLASEAIRLAALERFQIVTSECQPAASVELGATEVSGAPLHAFRSLLLAMADRCVERGTEYSAWLFGENLRLLGQYEPVVRDLPGQLALPEPDALPDDAALQRLLAAASDALCRFAQPQPLLFAIDDLQWADELSLKLLRFFVDNHLGSQPILIVANVRAEELTDPIRELAAQPTSLVLELGRLDSSTITRLASEMLSAPLPEHFADFLVQQSEGNPFFVAEYLRAAAAEGLLMRQDGEWGVSADFDALLNATRTSPALSSLQDLVSRRLGGLSEAARDALEAAAVLGREFAPELLSRAARAGEELTLSAIETLRHRQILETAAGGSLRFVHDRLRESAYAAILPGRRRELHRQVALALEAQYEGSVELSSQHAVLARHWAAARAPRRALEHFTKAAHAARAAFAVNDAINYFHGALREAHELQGQEQTDGRVLVELYEDLGELESRAGRQLLAREAFERADARLPAEDGIRRARLARRAGKTHELENRYHDALEALDTAERRLGPSPEGEAAPSPWHTEWLDIQIQRAWACYWTAPLSEMSALIAKTDATVELFGSATQRAHFFQVVALLHMRAERFLLSDESLEWARRAFVASLEAVPLERPGIHFTWAFALLFSGRLDEALPELERVLANAEKSSDTAVQCRALSYLLLVARRRGRIDETRRLAERTLALASSSQMKHYIGAAQANLGWASFRDGHVDSAKSLCEAALASWEAARPSVYPFQWLARWPLVALAVERGEHALALDLLRALLDAAEQRMPPAVVEPIERALAAGAGEERRRALAECLRLASNEGLI